VDLLSVDGPPDAGGRSVVDIASLKPFWHDLASRAVEPNPFAESAFLIPAIRNISPPDLTAVSVWDGSERARLNALAILRAPLRPLGIVDVWQSEQAPLPALLLDGERAVEALDGLFDWLARRLPAAGALGLPCLDVHGGVAKALRSLSAKRSAVGRR
jgi:hypothetical protein